jgi:hypothetical protein
MFNIIKKYLLKENNITFEELLENIKEINLIYKIIKDVKKSILYDQLDYYIKMYSNLNNYILYINELITEEFIEEFKDILNWKYICIYQYLSNEMIDKYSDYVKWFYVSKIQNISEENILKYKDKIYFKELFRNQYIIKKYGILICNEGRIDFYGYDSDYLKDIRRFYSREEMIKYFINKISP